MNSININLDKIIEKEVRNIEINMGRRKRNKIRINIEYSQNKQYLPEKKSIGQVAIIEKKEKEILQPNKERNYLWHKLFKKKKEKSLNNYKSYETNHPKQSWKEKKNTLTRKEKRMEKKNIPHKYESILEQIVDMKNNRENYQTIQKKYIGFSEKELLTKAFQDYQDNYCNKKFNNSIHRYDNKIATEEYKRKINELYQNSNKNLQEIAKDLSKEYGMNISTSTISRYARKELNVKNRKEAKEKHSTKK